MRIKPSKVNNASSRARTNTMPTKVSKTIIWISESEDGPGASQRSRDSTNGYSNDSPARDAKLASWRILRSTIALDINSDNQDGCKWSALVLSRLFHEKFIRSFSQECTEPRPEPTLGRLK